jgi:transposase
MTDGPWALPAPLFPAASTGGRGGRPEKGDRRLVLDAIFSLVRGGIAWPALPGDVPPHQTVDALSAGGPGRGRGAGARQRWVNGRVWPTGAAQCRPRP